MTDVRPRRGASAAARGDTLRLRLALAFLGVALTAIALLAGLVAVFAAADVSSLADRQREDLASAISVTAGAAWDRGGNWASADLSPVFGLAQRPAASRIWSSTPARTVAATPAYAAATGPRASAAVV